MKVVRSSVLGFCMGVRRAVELAFAEADNSGGRRVLALGSLVHNPKVSADLKSRGVEIVEQLPQNLENCSVIIRAHGISPAIEEKLRGCGCRIVDATCPKVKASQMKAMELSRAGYSLFLAGEEKHAEIAGILGYAQEGGASFCVTAGSAAEAEAAASKLYETNKDAKAALLGQTTISEKEYLAIASAIKNFFPNLEIVQTICDATTSRQEALREMLNQVEAVIIAGGKESANTCRLLAIAQESGKPCVIAEKPSDVPLTFHIYGTVGICAGASTPDSVINEIELEILR